MIILQSLSCTHAVFSSHFFMQYVKHMKVRERPIFELFPVILGIAVVWPYAHLMTMSGAYQHATLKGKMHCRTDWSNIIGTSPW